MAGYPPYAFTDERPNTEDNNAVGPNYMEQPDIAWGLGTNPTDDRTPVITKAIGNGQLGIGINAPMLDVATPLVFPPAIIVVLQVPAMYTVDGKPSIMARAIKDMFESHSKAITGIDIQYQMDPVGQTPVGADSQQIVSPGKTTRSAVNPSFSFTEISGNLYWNIIRKWLWDMNNPDTYAIGPQVAVQGGWTMSDYSVTFMAIQPDVTQRPDRIIDAAVFCNVFPTATGELGMERNAGQMKHMDRSFTFQAIVQHNAYTKQLGKIIMQRLALNKIDFNWAPPQRNDWTKSVDDAGIAEQAVARHGAYPAGLNTFDPSQNIYYDEAVDTNRGNRGTVLEGEARTTFQK